MSVGPPLNSQNNLESTRNDLLFTYNYGRYGTIQGVQVGSGRCTHICRPRLSYTKRLSEELGYMGSL